MDKPAGAFQVILYRRTTCNHYVELSRASQPLPSPDIFSIAALYYLAYMNGGHVSSIQRYFFFNSKRVLVTTV